MTLYSLYDICVACDRNEEVDLLRQGSLLKNLVVAVEIVRWNSHIADDLTSCIKRCIVNGLRQRVLGVNRSEILRDFRSCVDRMDRV